MKSSVIVLGLALASFSFTPSALGGGSGGDYYTIGEILPANPTAGSPISAVVIFSCSLPTANPQGEEYYLERDGATLNLVVSISWLGAGRCTPPPLIPIELPLDGYFHEGVYELNLYFVDSDTPFPVDLKGMDAADSVSFGVGPTPATAIPSLGLIGFAVLIMLLAVAALPFLRRNV